MIKRTTETFDDSTALGCKIESTRLAYGEYESIASFFKGGTAYCLWGDNMTVDGAPDLDFIRATGAKTILTASCECIQPKQQGEILFKDLRGEEYREIPPIFPEKLRQVCEFFNAAGLTADSQGFLLDTSHKLRHGLGVNEQIWLEGILVSCALSTYVTKSSAIITAVATVKDYRRMGFGEKAVKSLEAKLQGRRIFVLRENLKTPGFYESLGYSPVGRFTLGEMK